MPIRRIDSLGPTGTPDDLGTVNRSDEMPAPSTGFDNNDHMDAVRQPNSFDIAARDENFSHPEVLTATQKSQISDAAGKLLSDLPDIARTADYDQQKIADGVNLHIQNSLSQSEYSVLGNMNGVDIEAIAFLVMMEASKSAQEDLKAIMDGVKSINKQKEGWRTVEDTINKMTASFPNDDDDDK